MLVKCIKSFRNQIIEGAVYLVVEIIINNSTSTISYRIIDNDRYPSIYEAEKFAIVSNDLDGFAISFNNGNITLSPKLILDSKLNEKNVEGFWGLYIEDDVEAKQILQEVVCTLAENENITVPKLI